VNRIASQLRALREQAGLSTEQLAAQVGVDAGVLRDAEAGGATPSPAVLIQCALLAGLELDEFLRGASVQAPSIALLRIASEAGPDALRALRADRVPRFCGELLHRARMVQTIEKACAISRARLPTVARGPETAWQHPAEEDARRARAALGVPDGPIHSVRALLERHGVLIVWSEDEIPDDTLDGVSLVQPVAAVLANLRHGREKYVHTRMTLAHELGHLLFDHLRKGIALMYSPSNLRASPSLAGVEDIERAANAFAACFLAPAHLIQREVGALDPASEDAVVAVGRGFGVGRTVAINRLCDVFRLSDEARAVMESRPARRYEALGRDDVPREDEIGLRRGVFRQRVIEALVREMIPRERAWSLLGLSPSEALEDAPIEALRAPLVSREQTMIELARRAFTYQGPLDSPMGWAPVSATQQEGGTWRVNFVPGAGAPGNEEVFAIVTERGEIVNRDHLHEDLRTMLATKAIVEIPG
jgi:transcriptional regulator with XRE-family HTH domain